MRPSTRFVPGLVAILAIALVLASVALGAGSDLDRFVVHRLAQLALAITLILTVKLVKWADRWGH